MRGNRSDSYIFRTCALNDWQISHLDPSRTDTQNESCCGSTRFICIASKCLEIQLIKYQVFCFLTEKLFLILPLIQNYYVFVIFILQHFQYSIGTLIRSNENKTCVLKV